MFPAPPEPRRPSRPDTRRNLALAIAAFLTFVVAIPLVFSRPSGSELGIRGGVSEPSSVPAAMPIVLITDLDKRSKVDDSKKPAWKAYLKRAILHHDASTGKYSVEWTSQHEVRSGHGEGGRGMELSELVRFGGSMYAFDDRTGIIFEVENFADDATEEPSVYPRHILMEGDGNTDKGFKIEWATVQDGKLVVGSFGKEYTNEAGEVLNRNNMWVKVVSRDMSVSHEDWTDRYAAMRHSLGYDWPGYMIHEAAVWDPFGDRWIFLPRRASREPYNDVTDEKMGANLLITTDRNFRSFEWRTVGTRTPERGFSSAKLVPGSRGRVIVALKSAESESAGTQTSFITVFDTDGNELMPETEVPGGFKFEGVEFSS